MEIETVTPFPEEHIRVLWEYMQQFPQANFDDSGPGTIQGFRNELWRRWAAGEITWAVLKDGRCCGAVSFLPLTKRLGTLHGICFGKGLCSAEEKRHAVRSILKLRFLLGIEKISAGYFADNKKIAKFLSDLGAVEEGVLKRHTVRGGVPIDVIQVAIFPESAR